MTTLGGNLIEDSGPFGISHGTMNDQTGVDPMLGPLQNNGGPTTTHALSSSSAAVDAGLNIGAPTTDQRGSVRVVDGDGDMTATIDVGSYEYDPADMAMSSEQTVESPSSSVVIPADQLHLQTPSVTAVRQELMGHGSADASLEEITTADLAIASPEMGTWSVTVGTGDRVIDVNFGNRALPGEIRGQKFHDLDGDGEKDPDEPGLEGWEIYLDTNKNQSHDSGEPSVVTDADGNYVFPNLATETEYRIAEVLQPGWAQTFPVQGHWEFELSAGQVATSIDFGNIEDNAVGVGVGNIEGVVFTDTNGNNQQDSGEVGLPGQTIYLDLNNNGQHDAGEPTTVTLADDPGTTGVDEAGTYRFADRATGEYEVRLVLPSGGQQTFPEGVDNRLVTTTLPTETSPNSLAAGDFNRDGHLDFAVVNAGRTRLSIFFSDQNGSFLQPTSVDVGTNPQIVRAAHANADEYIDLVVSYSGTNFVSLLINDQNGGFTRSDGVTPFYAPWYSAPGDFDQDGDLDVAFTHLGQSDVYFLERIPEGFVSPATVIATGVEPASLISVQLNDDNTDMVVDDADRLDLAWVDIVPGANTVSALINNGSGAYTRVTINVGGRPFSVTAGDFDGDGFNDLAAAIPETDKVAILRNDQNGNFFAPLLVSAGIGPTALAAGDLDGDGDIDLAVTDASAEGVTLMRNDGTGQFVIDIIAAQLDDDSTLDLALASGSGASSVRFLANRLVERAQRITLLSDTTVSGVNFSVTVSPVEAVWDGNTATGIVGDGVLWSDTNNWSVDGITDQLPASGPLGDNIRFRQGSTVGTVDLETDRIINSIAFEDDFVLDAIPSIHTLTITGPTGGSAGDIDVQAGVIATINADIAANRLLSKTGEGTLVLGGTAPDVTIDVGTILVASTGTVQNLTVGVSTTAILNGPILGNLDNNGTIVVGGDLNGDGALDAVDIDLLYGQIPGAVPDVHSRFDLVADGVIDQNDVNELVYNVLGREFGDADLDGDVDIADALAVIRSFDPSGLRDFHSWDHGDFDGDGDVDTTDLGTVAVHFNPLGWPADTQNAASLPWAPAPLILPRAVIPALGNSPRDNPAVDAPLRTLAAIRVSEPRHSSGDSEYYRVDMAFAEFDADRMHYRRRFRRQSVKE